MNFISNPDADVCGTSFHGVTIHQSLGSLLNKLGAPHYEGGDKTQYEWFFTSEDGRVITLYDWKSYTDNPSVWNVGGLNKVDTEMFRSWFNRISG